MRDPNLDNRSTRRSAGLVPVFVAALLCLPLTGAAADTEPGRARFTWTETEPEPHRAQVRIDLNAVSTYTISPRLFGKFTENLGTNVYGGFWAQALWNPSLETDLVCLGRAQEGQTVAHAWLRWNSEGVRHRLTTEAPWNTDHAQALWVTAVPDSAPGAGIRQRVHLPLHRTGRYRVSVFVRGATAPLAFAVLGDDPDHTVLATATVPPPASSEWCRVEVELRCPAAAQVPPPAVYVCLGLAGIGYACFDQVTCFPADAVDGFDPEILELARRSRIRVLRFPGGNYVSGYHWKDDLVPLHKRPTRVNPAWGGTDPHHVGTDEHIRFCRLIGAEPLICVNAGNGTAQEAADWVEYCNGGLDTEYGRLRAANGHPAPYNVRLWELGNELWGDWQIGHCTAEEYARRYQEFHRAMTAVDPTIEAIACGDLGPDWNLTLMRTCPRILDSLSVHFLFPLQPQASPLQSYTNQIGYSHLIHRVFDRIRADGREHGRDLTVAVTECLQLSDFAYQSGTDNLSEALFYAGVLMASIRAQGTVSLFTHSALVNHGGGLRRREAVVYPNPVYHARCLLQSLEGAAPVSTSVACPHQDVVDWPGAWAGPDPVGFPLVDALACRHSDGRLTVVLLNRHPTAALELRLDLENGTVERNARLALLTGRTWHAQNEPHRPERVLPRTRRLRLGRDGRTRLELPPASLVLLETREPPKEKR